MKHAHLVFILLLSLASLVLPSCDSGSHFITDKAYRKHMLDDLKAKEEVLNKGNLFDILHTDTIQGTELEALQFLYAYMTLADIVDYDGAFYLKQVRASLKARDEMAWGKKIPERLFRHFVLPVRINNENLDSSRTIFYDELKERIKGMNMKEAVLEVNHWCHEKATYAPSSARTRSPLSTILNAIGRCGEESTFTVAALRAVGIPARQVYTPRWAHTDDNHAWVEAWVDGKWHFLGACEPAPNLDDAWFNSSVVRSILCYTKVFGRYDGPEEQIKITDNYTEINVIENYAPTDKLSVRVINSQGKAVQGANVSFTIYNYAEFYPAVIKQTDGEGRSSLRIGRGDMLIWAHKDGLFGYVVSKAADRKELTITLDTFGTQPDSTIFKIDPPTGAAIPTQATEAETAACQRRLVQEDSIRGAYEGTFLHHDDACQMAISLGLDSASLAPILVSSRGNHKAITQFLTSIPNDRRPQALAFLSVLSRKDYTDTPFEKLQAIFASLPAGIYTPFELKYILSPLAEHELITAYRPLLSTILTSDQKQGFVANPEKLVAWVNSQIVQDTVYNSQHQAISPTGVWRIRRADLRSQGLFFIALARTIGLPARYDEVTRSVQYSTDRGESWHNVNFRTVSSDRKPQGQLQLAYTPSILAPDPSYYSRFTIASMTPAGAMSTLAYDEDGEVRFSGLFARPRPVNAGQYFLISGTRMASGAVLARISPFTVRASQKTITPLILLSDSTDIQVIGSINAETLYHDITTDQAQSILSTTGRGYFAIAILGAGQEPTNHALKDIELVKADLEKWGRKILLLFPSKEVYTRYKPKDFPGLPSTCVLGFDQRGAIAQMLAQATNLPSATQLPIVVIADSFGRVVFVRQGYTIGIGEQMMQTIRKL